MAKPLMGDTFSLAHVLDFPLRVPMLSFHPPDMQAILMKMGVAGFKAAGVVFNGDFRNLRGSDILDPCISMCFNNRFGPEHMLKGIESLLTDEAKLGLDQIDAEYFGREAHCCIGKGAGKELDAACFTEDPDEPPAEAATSPAKRKYKGFNGGKKPKTSKKVRCDPNDIEDPTRVRGWKRFHKMVKYLLTDPE